MMIETVVWMAVLVGAQALMYWQAAGQIEELEHRVKQYEEELKQLRLMIESVSVNTGSEKRILTEKPYVDQPWTDKPKFNVSMDDSHSAAMRSMLKKDIK